MITRIIKKIFNIFGYEIISSKYKDFYSAQDLDKIYKKLFNDANLVIFDVGANIGQSIDRFRKIFPQSIIHCFEPIKENYLYIKKNYSQQKIFTNNLAMGDQIGKKKFFINVKSGTSSFYPINKKSKWAKIRSNEKSVTIDEFTKSEEEVEVMTVDKYCENNNIKKIDILKIDVQGYENKVLEGAINTIKNGLINTMEIEMNFSDHYEKKLSFYDIEKLLVPNGYELCAIKNTGWYFLDDSTTWFLDCVYKNKKLNKN